MNTNKNDFVQLLPHTPATDTAIFACLVTLCVNPVETAFFHRDLPQHSIFECNHTFNIFLLQLPKFQKGGGRRGEWVKFDWTGISVCDSLHNIHGKKRNEFFLKY